MQSTDARIAEAAKRIFSLSHHPADMSAFSESSSRFVASSSAGDKKSIDYLPDYQSSDDNNEMDPQDGACASDHAADTSDVPMENSTSNEDDDSRWGEKKPSSTERLQRR